MHRPGVILDAPQVQAHSSQGITEGRLRFLIPARLLYRQSSGMKALCHDDYQAEYTQKNRCRAADGFAGPLPLSFKSQAGTHLLKGHFDVPAQYEPFDDLLRVRVYVGAEEGPRLETVLRASNEHPPQGNGVTAGSMPEGHCAAVLDLPGLTAVPAKRAALPPCVLIQEPLGQAFLSCSFLGLWTPLAAWLGSRFIVECGVQPQPRDQGNLLIFTAFRQFHTSVSTVAYEHDLALRIPAADLAHQGPGPLGGTAMCSAELFATLLREERHGQEGQCPWSAAPRCVDEHTDHQPADTKREGYSVGRGAYGIPEHALIDDLLATPPLQGVVDEQDQWRTLRHKRTDNQAQQNAAHHKSRPARTVEHPMIAGEILSIPTTNRTQARGDGAISRRQDSSEDERAHSLEDGCGRTGAKRGQQLYNLYRWGRHTVSGKNVIRHHYSNP